MIKQPSVLAFVAVLVVFHNVTHADEPAAKSRHFELVYSGSIAGVEKGSRVRVWIPIAQNSEFQKIHDVTIEHFADEQQIGHDAKYANRILYLEADAENGDPLEFQLSYEVTRYEVRGLDSPKPYMQLRPSQEAVFLSASSLIPVDGRPLKLLDDVTLSNEPIVLARDLYDTVNRHMKYDKTQSGYGNGDVLWACDSGTGNCTDFHSLFLSLARSRNLPAYFEIGFPIPDQRGEGTVGGYHCWANCFVNGYGWVPVDISEADKDPELEDYFFGNLNENRVTFSIGRDIHLEPEAKAASLNYFVYPHVEVDDELWPADRIKMNFQYRDLAD